MAARLRFTSMLELCLWSSLLKVHLELLDHWLVLMLDIWKFIGWGCCFPVWLSGEGGAPMELTGFRSALIRSCVHQYLPIVGLPYGLHPVSFEGESNEKIISCCSGFQFNSPEAIMWKSDLLHSELAEVRVTEAALVGQQLSPPLQTPQEVIPGGHRRD